MSDVVLSIAGNKYAGWLSIDATISMETLSGQFTATITDTQTKDNRPIRALPTIKPGLSCEVYINGQIIITGYIDKVTPVLDANSHTITVQGRDKSGDLVDCSMIGDNQWQGLTVDEIVTRICEPFGIPVELVGSAGSPIDNFLVDQGASCFEIIQKLCYMRQLLAISDGTGGLTLTKAGSDRATTNLIEGINIKKGVAAYDFTERYSVYVCKGQTQGSDNSTPETVASNDGAYTDSAISRYRPLSIIAEGQADIDACKKRATWEGSIRRGKSRQFVVEVNNWAQENGSIWTINKLTTLKSVLLGVNDTLLIKEVNYRLDENGEITTLSLTSSESFTADPAAVSTDEQTNPYQED